MPETTGPTGLVLPGARCCFPAGGAPAGAGWRNRENEKVTEREREMNGKEKTEGVSRKEGRG